MYFQENVRGLDDPPEHPEGGGGEIGVWSAGLPHASPRCPARRTQEGTLFSLFLSFLSLILTYINNHSRMCVCLLVFGQLDSLRALPVRRT